jgi:putative tryptophan/tyrosine transport system substrate-binding protein
MTRRISHTAGRALLLAWLLLFSADVSRVSAQQVVAAIVTGNLPRYQEAHEALVQVFIAGGSGPDKVKLFVQTPNADRMSLANAARRAVAAGARIIIAYGAPAAEAAKKEAGGIPVLFADVHDPVALGLVKNLAAPGTEMSGATSTVPLEPLLRHLTSIKPIKQMGVLLTSAEAGSAQQAVEMELLAKQFGFTVNRQEVAAADRVNAAVGALLDNADALYFTESVALTQKAQEAIEQARGRGVPVISQIPGLGSKGALLTMEAETDEQGKLVAVHALQVLAGQKAHILPVRTARKITLVVNRRVAEQLGLKLPAPLLQAAGKVID